MYRMNGWFNCDEADLISDICLIVIPLSILWHIKLPQTQRRLILSIFASSILSSAAGILGLVFQIKSQASNQVGWLRSVGLAAHIKVCVMLIGTCNFGYWNIHSHSKSAVTVMVCNLLVIIPYIYRLFQRNGGDDEISESEETRGKAEMGMETDLGTVPELPPSFALILTEISDVGRTFDTRTSSLDLHSAPEDMSVQTFSSSDTR